MPTNKRQPENGKYVFRPFCARLNRAAKRFAKRPPTCIIQKGAHSFATHAIPHPKPRACLRLTLYPPANAA